jgi:uncharacterized protein YjlB
LTKHKELNDMKTEQHAFPDLTRFPLIVYRGALGAQGDKAAEECLKLFDRHGWRGGWTNGIYRFHHFHATTHEALGIVSGHVRVRFGGKTGPMVAVEAGDAVVIPAGISHCNEGASDDLVVVGAYPGGRAPDMERHGSDEMTESAREKVRAVPAPDRDPLLGKDGPLTEIWRRSAKATA